MHLIEGLGLEAKPNTNKNGIAALPVQNLVLPGDFAGVGELDLRKGH